MNVRIENSRFRIRILLSQKHRSGCSCDITRDYPFNLFNPLTSYCQQIIRITQFFTVFIFSVVCFIFLSKFLVYRWRAFAWMVAIICADGRVHLRDWSPSIAFVYSYKIKNRQGLLQAFTLRYYWGWWVLTRAFWCCNFALSKTTDKVCASERDVSLLTITPRTQPKLNEVNSQRQRM